MHTVARLQSIFDMIKSFDIGQSRKQFLSTKAERYELQKCQMQLLNQLQHFVVGLENINVYEVLNAITKSYDVQVKTEEIMEAYENFKKYVICISGQTNAITDLFQGELADSNDSVDCILQKINCKAKLCIQKGTEENSENFETILKYDLFQKDAYNLIQYIKKFIEKVTSMNLNDIGEVRKVLNCLKVQAECTLQRKWNLQKQILPFVCDTNKVLLLTGCSQLLLECIQDTMFNLKILEEIEFSKTFPVLSDLCYLRERKELLIEKFRHFVLRIGCQKTKHIPIIKKELVDFNKEIQLLLSDYHKFRFRLQYFSVKEEENLQNILEDIRAVITPHVQTDSDRKVVRFLPKRKVNMEESEVDKKRTKENLEEIGKAVDETMEFLHSLDEAVISKKFSAMRYLCELHCLKEQIISSFENFLHSIFKLNIDDDEAILKKLNQFNSAASCLIERYKTVGAQLIFFSDIMEIVHKEKSETTSNLNLKKIAKISEINVSDLFGTTESSKKQHYELDNEANNKWFPAKSVLFEMLKDKEKLIASFVNFLERMPDLNIENTMEAISFLRQLIIYAEDVLRRYQSLKLQLIWIAGECVFSIADV